MGGMMVVIVVYSCMAGFSHGGFNPHQINAADHYIDAHPGICEREPPTPVDVSLEECQSHAFLGWLPSWGAANPDRIWLGARCFYVPGFSHAAR